MQTAILFIVFNRPQNTERVFEAIRKARPPRLYVAADGPRDGIDDDVVKTQASRAIATSVDWPCELHTLFRDANLGCKFGPNQAIDWFFKHEEQGIILEDDCLPDFSFFAFCEEVLHRYSGEKNVWAITGCNFQNGATRGDGSYYFSRYMHVWGWATWREKWLQSDIEMAFWPKWKQSQHWKTFWIDKVAREHWERIFDRMYNKGFEAWDYPWVASIWLNDGLTVTPNVNLVSNIGFGPDATHTIHANSPEANLEAGEIKHIRHPSEIVWNQAADKYVFHHIYGGKWRRFPLSWIRPFRTAFMLLAKALNDYRRQ